ncbi:CPCC family cysteine-rich protein [Rhizobium rhododendri]|uniref:CPCC family cysteine-rich protein n=1 Tax=Rhizobium rhododendri TaxID=2506430 RepID=A0ABY8ISH8_9HYPH|nr:CPCC family cysteine-rich protein [Rhizobium rhododendri]WFS25849.1 CPCC family cysteine-rich protein [Rhizobium rhododendri]
MKIRKIDDNQELFVYGVVVHNNGSYLHTSPPGYRGLLTCGFEECDVLDGNFNYNTSYVEFEGGAVGVYYAEIITENLLDVLIETDPVAFARFTELRKIYDRPPATVAAIRRLGEDALSGSAACPCCDCDTLVEPGCYEVCKVCGWEDDPLQSEDAQYVNGANKVSLTEARMLWRARKT